MTETFSLRGPRWAGILMIGSLALAGPAAAQDNVYAEQVRAAFAEVHAMLDGMGYAMEGETMAWMSVGTSMLRWTLEPGSYMVLAACDEDCGDLDLAAYAGENPLDTDVELDATPVVEFTLAEPTDIEFMLDLLECGTSQCYVGLRWYWTADDMSAAAPTGGGDWEAQVQEQFAMKDDAADAAGYALVDERSGLIAPEDEQTFTLALPSGSYHAIAVCDNDCIDVDLFLYDSAGQELDSDVLVDDYPIVDFTVGSAGRYTFGVLMVTCETKSCGYGFRLYREGGG